MPTARCKNCSEETMLVLFETDKKLAELYSDFAAFGLRRQSWKP